MPMSTMCFLLMMMLLMIVCNLMRMSYMTFMLMSIMTLMRMPYRTFMLMSVMSVPIVTVSPMPLATTSHHAQHDPTNT